MTERRDKNDVRIFRMHDERADVARIFQADVLPILAAIDRLINAVAVSDVAAQAPLRPCRRKSCCDRDGATASAPIEEVDCCLSKIGVQFAPPSVVFQTPPATAPK